MIKITLPNPNDFQYKGGIKHFLRQFELCVHHAQKAYEEIQNRRKEMGEEIHNENELLVFRQPLMDFYDIQEEQNNEDGYINIHVDRQTEDGQEILLEIGEV